LSDYISRIYKTVTIKPPKNSRQDFRLPALKPATPVATMDWQKTTTGDGAEQELSDSEEGEVYLDQDDILHEFTVDDEVLPDRDDSDLDSDSDAGGNLNRTYFIIFAVSLSDYPVIS
jgi:hypothetical protein